MLRAVVESDGGDFERVRRTTIGFSAVPSLIAKKVDAVVTFWNAEGVALRERGVPTREFRVDEFGAPRYPELVVAVTRKTLDERRELVDDLVAALAEGTGEALEDSGAAHPRDHREVRRRPAAGGGAAAGRGAGAAAAPGPEHGRSCAAGRASTSASGSSRAAPDVKRAFAP